MRNRIIENLTGVIIESNADGYITKIDLTNCHSNASIVLSEYGYKGFAAGYTYVPSALLNIVLKLDDNIDITNFHVMCNDNCSYFNIENLSDTNAQYIYNNCIEYIGGTLYSYRQCDIDIVDKQDRLLSSILHIIATKDDLSYVTSNIDIQQRLQSILLSIMYKKDISQIELIRDFYFDTDIPYRDNLKNFLMSTNMSDDSIRAVLYFHASDNYDDSFLLALSKKFYMYPLYDDYDYGEE